MKKVLILGATGAMGMPLVQILSEKSDYQVYATSRNRYIDSQIHWLQGNGHDITWIKSLLGEYQFDAIVDFLNYSTSSFRERYELLLTNTKHYIFISSARVYAEYDGIIDEFKPRILDTCKDVDYLAKDSYDLAKARSEDLLNKSSFKNFTIVRPSITYNNSRLQFCLFELNEWIYRFFDGNSIIFPKEMESIYTTMTHGKDVAYAIYKLLFNTVSFGETFNISGGGFLTWGEILAIYSNAIEQYSQKTVKIYEIQNVEKIANDLGRYHQYRYARGISRRFSNEKIESAIGMINWIPIDKGLKRCIHEFFDNGASVVWPDFRRAAYYDRLVNEYTPLKRFDSIKKKIGYELCRFGLYK